MYTSCRYPHEDGPTNMILVEVRLVSGWVLDVGSLPQLDQDEEEEEEEEGPGVITTIEIDNDMVIFYLNKVTLTGIPKLSRIVLYLCPCVCPCVCASIHNMGSTLGAQLSPNRFTYFHILEASKLHGHC